MASGSDIYDVLQEYGFPKGILPNVVESYDISPTDGSFTIQLTSPCIVQLPGLLVSYRQSIKGKLTYESFTDISGIQAKDTLLWLPVNSIEMVSGGNSLYFRLLGVPKRFPAYNFQAVPECKSKTSPRESYAQLI